MGFLKICVVTVYLVITVVSAQHMICKTTDYVSSSEVGQDTPSLSGIVGQKGEKGDTGRRGRLDRQKLAAQVEEKLNSATYDLQLDIENLKQAVETLSYRRTASDQLQQCSHGFVYRSKCYFVSKKLGVTVHKAKQKCIARGGTLADIIDFEHEGLVQDEMIRRMMRDRSYHLLWTAMTYVPQARTLHLSTGEEVNSTSYSWSDRRFPSSKKKDTYVVIEALSNPGESGMFNRPAIFKTHGALCVKQGN